LKVLSYKTNNTLKKIVLSLCLVLFLCNCKGVKNSISKRSKQAFKERFNKNQFTGVCILDPSTKDTVFTHNSTTYFTPASNTKIFTLYSALKILPNKIPTLKYRIVKDTLYAEGTGDPTLLHPYFKDRSSLNFLKKFKHIAFNFSNYKDTKFGPGWAWEDYDASFSPERNAMPVYGNLLTIQNTKTLHTTPVYFKDRVFKSTSISGREIHENIFYYNPKVKDTLEIPFITSPETTKHILEDILEKNIRMVPKLPKGPKSTLYSIATDTVYKRMMHKSDNFLAEQLMVMSSGVLKDTLNFSSAKNYILNTYLKELKQKPRWVDGSGLSRYNLFTPESLVHVLHKLYKEVPKKRLFCLFPPVYQNNTQKEAVYLYAKSGSLGNTYCLSGFLKTRSGKTLIFSFMNNHFRQRNSEIKRQMHAFLQEIRDRY